MLSVVPLLKVSARFGRFVPISLEAKARTKIINPVESVRDGTMFLVTVMAAKQWELGSHYKIILGVYDVEMLYMNY